MCVLALYFFSPVASPIPFYACVALSQLFFCGFQYAFASLGNKVGMAVLIQLRDVTRRLLT